MNERYDDLDLALAALPLEQPPAGLRASILAATRFRAPAFLLSVWDISIIGTLLAIAVWLGVVLADGGLTSLEARITMGATFAATRFFSNIPLLLWFAAGALTAFGLSFASAPGMTGVNIPTRR